jgi:ribonuclease P protein component
MITIRNRFHGHTSLNFAYKKGQTQRNPQLSLKYVRNDHRQDYRLAVVVSRKVDKSAVRRNRIRRRIYEIVRSCDIQGPYDLVFTVFSGQLGMMEAVELRELVVGQLRRAKVLTSVKSPGRAIVKTESEGQ